jgi:hypothetical protein
MYNRMFARALRLPLLVCALAACASVPAKTPVTGNAAAIDQLAGEWEGLYTSDETGRSGTIAFRLRAGSDTAEGDVVMTSREAMDAATSGVHQSRVSSSTASEVLTIRFVFVSDGEVRGVLNPYRDPDCRCILTTTFRGMLRGNVIEGSFISEGEGIHHLPTKGRWRVVRKSDG